MHKDINRVHECREHVINCSSAGLFTADPQLMELTLRIIKLTEFNLSDVKLESKIILNDQIE